MSRWWPRWGVAQGVTGWPQNETGHPGSSSSVMALAAWSGYGWTFQAPIWSICAPRWTPLRMRCAAVRQLWSCRARPILCLRGATAQNAAGSVRQPQPGLEHDPPGAARPEDRGVAGAARADGGYHAVQPVYRLGGLSAGAGAGSRRLQTGTEPGTAWVRHGGCDRSHTAAGRRAEQRVPRGRLRRTGVAHL